MDVSDRRMQVQLTQEARIASDFSYIRAILAVVGFVSALCPRLQEASGTFSSRAAGHGAGHASERRFVAAAIPQFGDGLFLRLPAVVLAVPAI